MPAASGLAAKPNLRHNPAAFTGPASRPGRVSRLDSAMGKEARVLLAVLGMLLGVFCGVLAMKLLIPRPPQGAGPDIHLRAAAQIPAEPLAIVPPPEFTPHPRELFESPPVAESPEQPPSRFSQAAGFGRDPEDPPAETVAPAALLVATPLSPFPEEAPLPHVEGPGSPAASTAAFVPATIAAIAVAAPTQPDVPEPLPAQPPVVIPGQPYVTAESDTWWAVAEAAYGDGRMYRSLFAWNRAISPRVSLVPGTTLAIPTREQLEAAWPQLMPATAASVLQPEPSQKP
jgi:hypothetical protein